MQQKISLHRYLLLISVRSAKVTLLNLNNDIDDTLQTCKDLCFTTHNAAHKGASDLHGVGLDTEKQIAEGEQQQLVSSENICF